MAPNPLSKCRRVRPRRASSSKTSQKTSTFRTFFRSPQAISYQLHEQQQRVRKPWQAIFGLAEDSEVQPDVLIQRSIYGFLICLRGCRAVRYSRLQ
jgi:hypothetical protein